MTPSLFLGTEDPAVAELASTLGSPLTAVPAVADGGVDWSWGEQLDAWREGAGDGEAVESVVVAAWSPRSEAASVTALGLDAWLDRAEAPLAVWSAALGVAARRCADGGTVVAVSERPSPLDAAGRGAESAVADGVEAMVRSLARSEGPRGVRVNLVTTPTRLAPDDVVAPAPSLPNYPGTVAVEVAGAVRMLLSPGADGVTGTVVHADCGRSWR
jgi:NAD(P)-dependent dehydrogenase (short-subunit alcohol dehydrogenase family)